MADDKAPPPPTVDMEELIARRDAAATEKGDIRDDIEDIFDYVIPHRRGRKNRTGRLTSRVYEATPQVSGFKWAGKLHQDMFPNGQANVGIVAGEVLRHINRRQADALDKKLVGPSKLVNTIYSGGDWSTSFSEMALDMVAGTGAMRMLRGDSPNRFMRFSTRSILDMSFESDGYGEMSGAFEDCKWSARDVLKEWPDARKIEAIAKMDTKEDRNKLLDLRQDEIFVGAKEDKPWRQVVWWDGDRKTPISVSATRTRTMLTPRYLRVAGDSWGLGVGHLALPPARTANVAQELTLRAAAIALLGIYLVDDDMTVNIDQLLVEPGAFWKVRQGFRNTRAIERLQDPRIDLANIIMQELRQQVQQAMMDHSLPPDAAGAKSAVEIMERIKRNALDNRIAFGRMHREIIVPSTRHFLEVAFDMGLLRERIDINDILVAIEVTSPVGQATKLDRVQRQAEYLQMLLAIDPSGQMARALVKIEQMLESWRPAFGIEADLVYTIDDRDQIKRTVDAMVKTALAAAMASMQQVAKAAPKGAAPAAEEEFSQVPVAEPVA